MTRDARWGVAAFFGERHAGHDGGGGSRGRPAGRPLLPPPPLPRALHKASGYPGPGLTISVFWAASARLRILSRRRDAARRSAHAVYIVPRTGVFTTCLRTRAKHRPAPLAPHPARPRRRRRRCPRCRSPKWIYRIWREHSAVTSQLGLRAACLSLCLCRGGHACARRGQGSSGSGGRWPRRAAGGCGCATEAAGAQPPSGALQQQRGRGLALWPGQHEPSLEYGAPCACSGAERAGAAQGPIRRCWPAQIINVVPERSAWVVETFGRCGPRAQKICLCAKRRALLRRRGRRACADSRGCCHPGWRS